MKVSKAQAQENRARIVETAATLFRERGYDGIGVADLMAAAGFTHGGFYKHFRSKADLMAEAAACGLAQNAAKAGGVSTAGFLADYLSRAHRDRPGDGCTLAALASDASRQPVEVKDVFAAGIESLLAIEASSMEDASEAARRSARARTLATIAHVVGAVILSRACPDDAPLADEVLAACRSALLEGPARPG